MCGPRSPCPLFSSIGNWIGSSRSLEEKVSNLQLVTWVTDRSGKDWHSQYTGMRFFSKIVTTMLLLVLGVGPLPLYAATPCQNQAKSSMCCAAGCQMATAMKKASAQSRIESGTSMKCGCQVSPSAPALVAIAPATRESSAVALVDNPLAGFALIVAVRVEESYIPPDRESFRHSQSVLCTFQI